MASGFSGVDAIGRRAHRRQRRRTGRLGRLAFCDPFRICAIDPFGRSPVKPSLRGALLTVVIALVAGFGGVWFGMHVFHASPHPQTLHELVHHEFRLTADQDQRIAGIEANFATRRRALELEMQAANADLASAIREEHGYGSKVSAAIERFHGAMGRLQTETIQHVFAMRAVLTPAQRAKFDDTIASALTTDTR
ncbi:MAG: periplasmic heavy metal sensor [Proteobacteria bacterium]|nr:periplasmic heavy metal sensor [Pseudomonadota bacterium]